MQLLKVLPGIEPSPQSNDQSLSETDSGVQSQATSTALAAVARARLLFEAQHLAHVNPDVYLIGRLAYPGEVNVLILSKTGRILA